MHMINRQKKLLEMFSRNFEKYLPFIDQDVKAAVLGLTLCKSFPSIFITYSRLSRLKENSTSE